MGSLVIVSTAYVIAAAAFIKPWIGVCGYYLLALLGPQFVWWWLFGDFRATYIIAIGSLSGVLVNLFLKNEYDYSYLFNAKNLWALLLWVSIIFSYYFGAYRDGSFDPWSEQVFSVGNVIFVFYFCSSIEINRMYKLRFLFFVFIVSVVYLIFWANNQYFSQNWSGFRAGRLMGPIAIDGGSIYNDENTFAMLFVTGFPFIYYLGYSFGNFWKRSIVWAVIPFCWHAIFLTGSRGGLLGIGITICSILYFSSRKFLIIFLLLIFFLFYQLQAGSVMEHRSSAIINIDGERSAGDRLIAWRGGAKMILAHPVTGVGVGKFSAALPNYIEIRNMVAHNTFIQFTAESGVLAGVSYIMLIISFLRDSFFIRSWCLNNYSNEDMTKISIYNNAATSSFLGLIVCSLFLSLNTYEVFFFLLLFNNCLKQTCLKQGRN